MKNPTNQIGGFAAKLFSSLAVILSTTEMASAVDRTWTGAAGTTLLNTAGNWSGGAAPTGTADTGIWDGTVQTNVPYTWNAQFGPTSGQLAQSYIVRSAYTSPIQIFQQPAGDYANNLLVISNLTLEAGSGAFTLGSNGVPSGTAFRATGTNILINNSANTATIASNVGFNSGGGGGRTIQFGGSGNWDIYSPWNIRSGGSGTLNLLVQGTGANTLILNTGADALSGTDLAGSVTINAGTLLLANGNALGVTAAHTVSIAGGGGVVNTLALSNNISLNPVVNNINITGRSDTSGSGSAAILNLSGNNSINGIVRFNATNVIGDTNIVIYTSAGSVLNLNSNITAANVTGNRYVNFNGSGDVIVNGTITNGSAVLGIVLGGGTLTLNSPNTYTGQTILNGGVLNMGNQLALASTPVAVNGGELNINGGVLAAPQIGGLSGSGVVDTLSGGTPVLSVGNNNVSSSFAGMITNSSGVVTLNKIGSGTFTMSGANGYSGGTVVSNGTLLVNNTTGSGTGPGSVTVVSGGAFGGTGSVQGPVSWQSGSAAQFTVTPTTAVSGSNSTPFTVSGTVALSGNNVTVNVAGGVPLSPGTYKLMNYTASGSSGAFAGSPLYAGAGAQLGTSSSISTSGGIVTLTVTFTGNVSTWTNNANGNWTVGANWSSNPYYPQTAGDSATLGVGAGFTTVTLNGPVTVGTLILTNQNSFAVANAGNALTFGNIGGGALISMAAGSSNSIAAPIALATNLTIARAAGTVLALTNVISNVSGAKSLTMTGNGTVTLSGNNTYGPASGTVGTTVGGGTLELANNNALSLGDVSLTGSSTLRALTGLTLANNIIDGAGTATVDNNGNNVTLSGAITGGGALAKSGVGQLTLNGANSYAGDSTFNGGNVVLGNASGIPGGTNKGNVFLGDGVTLNLNGNSVVLNGLNSSTNTASVDNLAGGTVTLTLGESGAFATFLGSIKNTTGTLNLVKDGTGTETLAGTNTYTGTTTVNAGTLQIGNGGTTGNVGPGGVSLTATNANLAFNLAGPNSYPGNITGSGTVSLNNTNLILWLTGNNTFTGNVTVNSGTLWITNAASLGTGPKTVIAQGGLNSIFTRLRLAGNITIGPDISFQLSYFNGVLVNDSGTNTIQGPIAMPNGGGNPDIVSSNGFLTLAGDISTVTGNNPRALTLDGPADGLVSGNVLDAGPAASVTKTGSGTWTMTGSGNNYSGATTVSNGTLIINGTLNGNGAIAVNGGMMLLNGTYNGTGAATVASGGAFGGIGTMYSPVTWQAGAIGAFSASASGSTPMTIYNAITLNNNSITVNVTGGTPLPVGSYTLLTEPNIIYSITGSFASTPTITGAGIAPGTTAFITTSSTAVTLTVASSSVWTLNGNGNWTTGANWSSNPNYPNAAGQFATFGVGSSLTTVNLDASETIGGLSFTNPNSFVISSGVNTLTLNNNGSGAAIGVAGGAANSITAAMSLNDGTTINLSTNTALSIPANISGSSPLTVTGNGVLSLSGNNSYSGNLTMNMGTNGGTMVLGSTTALGTGTITFTGGNLDSSAPNLVNANNNAQNWNGSFTFLGTQSLNLGNGNVNLGASSTLNINSNTLAVGGSIGGSFGLTKIGSGTLVLAGANTFTGGFLITNGTVVIGSDTAFGTGTLNLGIAGASAGLTIRSADSTAHVITNSWSVNAFADNVMAGAGDLTFTGPLASGNGEKHLVISNAVTTISGNIADGGAPSGPNVKAGPGKLVLSGNNVMTKQFRIDAGTLALGSTNAIGSGALIINGGGLDSAVANLTNANNNVQTWAGSFFFAGSQNLNLGNGAVTMTTNTTITVSNNTLVIGGAVNGPSYSLTKAGAGTLVLSGTNTYGNTAVTGGTLEIAQATLATNSTVSISNSAVLQLDFNTTNQVAALVLGGNSQTAGVYKAGNSGGLIAGSGSLMVVPLGPTGPAQITNSVSGSTLSLSWPAGQGWKLQMQTNSLANGLSTNWTYITDGSVNSTNITIDASKPTVFYRLTYP